MSALLEVHKVQEAYSRFEVSMRDSLPMHGF